MSERIVPYRLEDLTRRLVNLANDILEVLSHAFDCAGFGLESSIRMFKRRDHEITLKEIDLEQQCLNFIATDHPTATDLRSVASIMKAKEELERINDMTLHLIERIIDMRPEIFESFEFREIGGLTITMTEMAVAAFAAKDPAIGEQVHALDEQIHAMLQKVIDTTTALMRATTINPDQLLASLSISRHLGRIADQASVIARTPRFPSNEVLGKHEDTFVFKPSARSLSFSSN